MCKIFVLIMQASGLKTSKEDIQKVYKAQWIEHQKQHPIYGAYQGLTSEQFWRGFVHRIFNELGFENDYKAVDRAADMLIHDFDSDPDMWEFIPHARGVLDHIKTAGLRQGVISTFDARLEPTLQRQSIRHYFDVVVTCMDAMAEKPDSRIFEYALRRAGVQAHETVHVGDDVQRDFMAARRVGMKAILLNVDNKLSSDDLQEVPADYVVQSLAEIPYLIKHM